MGIEETIALMQKNPKMFVQEERIDYIFYFLDGGCAVMQSDDIERHFTCWFGKWLIKWIEENFDKLYTPKTVFWYEDIKFIAKDEQNDLKVFFDLCKLFFADYHNKAGYFSWRKEVD